MSFREEFNQNSHIPTPPTSEGVWSDKSRDHDYFQLNVPLVAQLGGASWYLT